MTTMYCPNCEEIQQCYCGPPVDQEGHGLPHRVFFGLPYLTVNAYQRDRQCIKCGGRRTTVEIDRHDLELLISVWKIVDQGAEVLRDRHT